MCAYLLESLDLASTARHSEMLPRRPPRLYDGTEYPLPLPPSLPTAIYTSLGLSAPEPELLM